MSQSSGISYALYGLWAVGIVLTAATVFLTWVSVDAVTSVGGSAATLSGIDVMSMHGGDAVPGGTLGIVLVLYAFVSAVLLVLTRMYPERLGLAGTQLLFAVMTVTVLLFLSDAGSGFSSSPTSRRAWCPTEPSSTAPRHGSRGCSRGMW